MTAWEYGYLKFHTEESGRKAKLFFEGKEAKHYQGEQADLLSILNELGGRGWEAISHTYDFPSHGAEEDEQWMSILLKRSKS